MQNLKYRLMLKKISLKYIDLYLFEEENLNAEFTDADKLIQTFVRY